MDEIPVRQMRFDFDQLADQNPVWSKSSPNFSLFMNSLGVHVPHFERFLVAVMREYRDELKDPQLLCDVQAIIGQEAHHAFNFVNWTKALIKRYPALEGIDDAARSYFERAKTIDNKRFKIGFTAGYETFTFLGGMIILNRYEELMGIADPNLRALWVWHQVEEVEHGAVAFDFYKAFYPEDEWYRRWMVLFAFCHISWETFKAFRVMLKGEGFAFKRRLKAWGFFISFASDLAWAALPVLSRSYHPRHHPICTTEQNQIAVAWRRFFSSGQDARQLTDKDMKLIKGAML